MDKKLLDMAGGEPTEQELDAYVESNFWWIADLRTNANGDYEHDNYVMNLFRLTAERFMLQEKLLKKLIELVVK